jgi:hypothetical protein
VKRLLPSPDQSPPINPLHPFTIRSRLPGSIEVSVRGKQSRPRGDPVNRQFSIALLKRAGIRTSRCLNSCLRRQTNLPLTSCCCNKQKAECGSGEQAEKWFWSCRFAPLTRPSRWACPLQPVEITPAKRLFGPVVRQDPATAECPPLSLLMSYFGKGFRFLTSSLRPVLRAM